ncbi:MAG TPA: ribosomal protein S18-alanine N-acetyltransferase [Vicinamibacterales bacterium]|nr:ribosomal protein S18-alanine N-acetyltransferase [Vicinamibacterales bacterium]
MIIERVVGTGDIEAVAALEAACFTNPWTLEMLQRELEQNPHVRVYVLRLPELPVAAFCACWIIRDELHINTIAVDEGHRRQGLARALMIHVMADAARAGAQRATLEVRQSNEPARRLYSALGFGVAGLRRGYYTDPDEDALILWSDELQSGASPAGSPRRG